MKRIEQEMATAIRNRRNWKKSNTAVQVIEAAGVLNYEVINVSLFDNLIAIIRPDVWIFTEKTGLKPRPSRTAFLDLKTSN